jgi:hypothetical protein
MDEQLPKTTPEQDIFYDRVGKEMASLVKLGVDLRPAQREATKRVAEKMLPTHGGL